MQPKPDKLVPALYGGIVIGILSGVPFLNLINCLCCAGIMLGGVLGVYFYQSAFLPGMGPLEAGESATVGLISGVFGAIIETVIAVVLMSMFGNVWIETIVEFLTQANVKLPDEVWDNLYDMLETEMGPVRIMTDFFFSLLISSLFGMLGGLIGYSIFKRRWSAPPQGPVAAPGQQF